MEAVARAVRIYGTNSDRPAPVEPFVSESFPQPGDRCSVFVGNVPQTIEEELRFRNAYLSAALKRTFMNGAPLDESVPHMLRDQLTRPAVEGGFAWHVTYVFERAVEVPANAHAPDDSRFSWLDLQDWAPTDRLLREEVTAAFDALLAYTVGVITPTYFDHLALPLAMYYVTPGRGITAVPQFRGSAGSATVSHNSPFPVEALRERVASLGGRDWEAHAWLGRVWSWHRLALTEPPGWRLFMAAWTGLDVLTRRAGRRSLAVHGDRTDLTCSLREAMTFAGSANPPLAADFAALALELAPRHAERDFERFMYAKRIRDRLLHGDPLDEESLPAVEVRALLGEYVELATRKYTAA